MRLSLEKTSIVIKKNKSIVLSRQLDSFRYKKPNRTFVPAPVLQRHKIKKRIEREKSSMPEAHLSPQDLWVVYTPRLIFYLSWRNQLLDDYDSTHCFNYWTGHQYIIVISSTHISIILTETCPYVMLKLTHSHDKVHGFSVLIASHPRISHTNMWEFCGPPSYFDFLLFLCPTTLDIVTLCRTRKHFSKVSWAFKVKFRSADDAVSFTLPILINVIS